MASAGSPIALQSKLCLAGFNQVCSTLQEADLEAQYKISSSKIRDERDRFSIWSGNLGALQHITFQSSLDYRLRDVPKLSAQICTLLIDLKGALEGVQSIASGQKKNRVSSASDCKEFFKVSDDSGSLEVNYHEVPTISEIQELSCSISDNISHLFKISVIIRNATARDRYVKAAAAATEPFDDRYDIAHVGHKFPHLELEGKKWFKIRLGKASAWRRQYLRYCREHHEKLSAAQSLPDASEITGPESKIGTINPVAPMHAPNLLAPSLLAPTTASTLIHDDVVIPQTADDQRSQVSYATSVNESSTPDIDQIMPLEKASGGRPEFECPYCWTIQRQMKENSWRKHALNDIRPYVCSFEDCSLKLFAERHAWFEHEMQNHRCEWRCNFCSRGLDDSSFEFKSAQDFKCHLQSKHGTQITQALLPVMIHASQHAPHSIPADSCPFCDEWEQTLRKSNPISPEETLVVTPDQFMKHVGSHMVQVALFALPRIYDDEEDARSNAAAIGVDTEQSSDLTSVSTNSLPQEQSSNLTNDIPNSFLYDKVEEKKQALEEDEKILGLEHPDTLARVSGLAWTLRDQGRLKEAEEMYRRALAGREKVLGVEHPDTLTSVSNLASTLGEQGRFKEAEELYRRALAGREKMLGPMHPNTLGSINDLALTLRDQGWLEDAEEMYQRALVQGEKTFGRLHESTLYIVDMLGNFYQGQGKLDEAEEMYQRALIEREEGLGKENPHTLDIVIKLGTLYRQQGKWDEAEKMCERAFAGREKAYGREDTLTQGMVNKLADLCRRQGRLVEAEEMYQRIPEEFRGDNE